MNSRLFLLSSLSHVVAFGFIAFLAACGDDVTEVTNIYQSGLEVVDSVKGLPKCTDENEGQQAWVKGEPSVRICSDGEWFALSSGEGSDSDFSCKTEELKDGSGLKIVCNGDSIGVVLNGSDGKDGKAGKDGEDGKDAVIPSDTLENDSERVAISLDSLVGFTQKGPFLKGSTVYLYELSDGRTLKQTNGNFTSNITRDDGRYKFTARDLVSQYAMVVVDGYYRNEVTGESSNAPIRLKAITDMRKRSSVNVNILTHLEFERVYHLVTKGDSTGKKLTVKQAKRQAQQEILKAFYIELDSTADAEDMDVFGSSEADAALLALSILLQGDRTETEMLALLSEISTDMAETGVWSDSVTKAAIADWAFGHDLYKFRMNVFNWHLGNDNGWAGDFEKYINNYIAKVFGMEVCKTVDVSNKKIVQNPLSALFGRSFECSSWAGQLTWIDRREKNPYLNDTIQYHEMLDWRDRRVYKTVQINMEFIKTNDDGDYMFYSHAPWMAENLDFEYRVNGKPYGSYCYKDDCDSDTSKAYGRYYTWGAAMDSAGLYSAGGKNCGRNKLCNAASQVRGICPEGWHLPTQSEFKDLVTYVLDTEYNMSPTHNSLALRAHSSWKEGKENGSQYLGNGDDCLGFSAIATGSRKGDNQYADQGRNTRFWSSTEGGSTTDDAYTMQLFNANPTIFVGSWMKYVGMNIRCVKNEN